MGCVLVFQILFLMSTMEVMKILLLVLSVIVAALVVVGPVLVEGSGVMERLEVA